MILDKELMKYDHPDYEKSIAGVVGTIVVVALAFGAFALWLASHLDRPPPPACTGTPCHYLFNPYQTLVCPDEETP